MLDWIQVLSGFSQEQISGACERYIRREPKRRPAPADIRSLIHESRDSNQPGEGDRSRLTYDERTLLETVVLPRARRWMAHPELRDHAAKTLSYWGEMP